MHPFEAGKGRHKLALFHHFQAMVPRLCAAVADHTVVLRPHPAENHATWLELAKGCPNLQVVNEGNVIPWLLASKALVANSCTTMVESAVLDVPTVNFEPVTSAEYDYQLPNTLSRSAVSIDDVCALVVSMVRGEIGPLGLAERRATLAPHLAALDGPLAADRMVDVLDECGYRGPAPARAAAMDAGARAARQPAAHGEQAAEHATTGAPEQHRLPRAPVPRHQRGRGA